MLKQNQHSLIELTTQKHPEMFTPYPSILERKSKSESHPAPAQRFAPGQLIPQVHFTLPLRQAQGPARTSAPPLDHLSLPSLTSPLPLQNARTLRPRPRLQKAPQAPRLPLPPLLPNAMVSPPPPTHHVTLSKCARTAPHLLTLPIDTPPPGPTTTCSTTSTTPSTASSSTPS